MSGTKNIKSDRPDGLLTVLQVSQVYGVTRSAVGLWIADGCPVAIRSQVRGSPHLLDLEQVRAWKKKGAKELDPQREKALLDRERRLKVTAERLVLEGKLIPTAAVQEHWGQIVAAAKAKFLSFPHKVAPAVVSCETLIEVENEARRLIDEALEELAVSGVPDMEAAAEADGQSMGGQIPETESGGELGTRPVEDEQGGISTGDDGCTQ